jgi:lipopolysaccharide export system permease protein
VLYTEHYDEVHHALKKVIIHDERDRNRPLTIFAANGNIGCTPNQQDVCLVLQDGSIHTEGKSGNYQLINFGEYVMTIGGAAKGEGITRNEFDMSIGELLRNIGNPAVPAANRLKMRIELQNRFAIPFAAMVFAVVAVPLGMQNRRSGKSAGFSVSIAVLLAYYVMLSLLRTLAERGNIPPALAVWLPNIIFLAGGWYLLRLVSLERSFRLPTFGSLLRTRKSPRS